MLECIHCRKNPFYSTIMKISAVCMCACAYVCSVSAYIPVESTFLSSTVLHGRTCRRGSEGVRAERSKLNMNSPAGIDRRSFFVNSATTAAGYLGAGSVLRLGLITGPVAPPANMVGKRVLITGGNTGLGYETAVALARMGADVVIGCRNPDKAAAALEKVKIDIGAPGKDVPGGSVEAGQIDLSSLKSITRFADNFKGPLDVLVNNAGVMAVPTLTKTTDNFEMHMGINHLGHFLLTNRLLDTLKESKDGRVVNVSSIAHEWSDSLRDLDFSTTSYDPWVAYGRSKLANILFTRELHRRLTAASESTSGLTPSVTVMCCHPGVCRTELGRYIVDTSKPINPVALPLLAAATLVTRSSKQGAQTQITCSSSPNYGHGSAGGMYLRDNRPAPLKKVVIDNANAKAGWLWEESEKLTGAEFAI